MPNLFLTLLIAFVLIVCAIALLAIGWLVTGRSCLKKGCGMTPDDKGKGSCSHCGRSEKTDDDHAP